LIKEISNSLKASLYERVSAPILGAYTITWLLYNWKGLLPLFFGKQDIDLRVKMFEDYLYSGGWQASADKIYFDGWLRFDFFLIPLFIAMLLAFLSPYVQSIVFNWKEKIKADSLKKKEKLDSSLRLTLEQSIELKKMLKVRHEIYEQDSAQERVIHTNEINSYQKRLDDISKEKDEIEKTLSSHQKNFNEVHDSNRELHKELAESGNSIALLVDEKHKISNELLHTKEILSEFERGIKTSDQVTQTLSLLLSANDISSLESLTSKILGWFDNAEEIDSLRSDFLHPLFIKKFQNSTSYDYADDFFDKLIKPSLPIFDDYNLILLAIAWKNNDQIHDRRRASDDLKIIEAQIGDLIKYFK